VDFPDNWSSQASILVKIISKMTHNNLANKVSIHVASSVAAIYMLHVCTWLGLGLELRIGLGLVL